VLNDVIVYIPNDLRVGTGDDDGSGVRVGVNDGVLVGVIDGVTDGVRVGVGDGLTGVEQSIDSLTRPVLLTLAAHESPSWK
jgi:hypothetical protein